MRSDPYQIRAREIATEKGLDPDARVGEGRGQPVWCRFRQTARDEHLAREAAALVLPPQLPEFQNSPLKIFGEADDNTLAQMKNCMAVGNVVSGVLCAESRMSGAQTGIVETGNERQSSRSLGAR
jgi:tRNA-splicing ligase RtcB (3'-phosphate/5'-hydroxy nucleic acid ligase)